MEHATVRSGPNVATAQARTSGAAAWARRAAAAGSQAGRRAGGAPKSTGATDMETSGRGGDLSYSAADERIRRHISSCSSCGVRPTAMLGAPVFRITRSIVTAAPENASILVRNYSDFSGREWASLPSTERSVDK